MCSSSSMRSWRTSSYRRGRGSTRAGTIWKEEGRRRPGSPSSSRTRSCRLRRMRPYPCKRRCAAIYRGGSTDSCSHKNSWPIWTSRIGWRPCDWSIGLWSKRMRGWSDRLRRGMPSSGSGYSGRSTRRSRSNGHTRGTGGSSSSEAAPRSWTRSTTSKASLGKNSCMSNS